MKRIIALFLLMISATTGVIAEIPSFLINPILNFSGDYTVSLSFDNSDEVAALICEIDEGNDNTVNWSTFLKTLLTFDGKVKVQSDIDSDFEKIKFSLAGESTHNIDVNRNLSVGVSADMGVWVDADISNSRNFGFDVIYTTPMTNRYVKFTKDDIPSDAMPTEEDFRMLKSVFNKYYIENYCMQTAEILGKYAVLTVSGNKHTISLDNEAFTSYMDEMMSLSYESTYSLAEGEETFLYEDNIPKFKGHRILGDEGIKIVYTVNGNKISAEEITADISIDLSSIYSDIQGEPWPYTAPSKIDFSISCISNITQHGSTKVDFPSLTEGNSVSYRELYPYLYYEDDYNYEDYITYPHFYVGETCDVLPVIDDEIYVPLRRTLEAAYDDSVNIEYIDGQISVTSEYFTEFCNLKLSVDSDKAYADDIEYTIGTVILENGTTYVSNKLFTDVFAWEFSSASYDMIEKNYYYSFYTEKFY